MADQSTATQLRQLLASCNTLSMPCCFDALSARLIEQAGFPLTFMSGFATSAARLGLPDTGLISFSEMLDQGRNICDAVKIPVIGDADTGYGNPLNVRRTVRSYARAGFACAMIEDQESPKRCGHTRGKKVVDRQQALNRIRAAVDERKAGSDILIMARTDARFEHGLEEALWRCQAFADLGADIIFLEAPQSIEEMRTFCQRIPGYKMANMVEQGDTPLLTPGQLSDIGYHIVAYPLTLLSSAIHAMRDALDTLRQGEHPEHLVPFDQLRQIVGFDDYDQTLSTYPDE